MSSTKRSRILVIDDDTVSAQQLILRLEKKGYQCEHSSNPIDILENSKNLAYDLILLDIMMPSISGIDVLKKLREEANSFELPIIMVTSKTESEDIVEALKAGANDYLVKPVNIEIAQARINTQLKVKNLIEESLSHKQMSTISAMVSTLNHEINNPLSIAIGNLTMLKASSDETQKIDRSIDALNQVAKIVKKVQDLSRGDLDNEEVSNTVTTYNLDS